MRASVVMVVVVVLAAAVVGAYRVADPVEIELEIKVHPQATPILTQADVTRITSEGSALLQQDEFAGDVRCAVKIVAKKLDHIVGGGDGIVDSPAAFAALFIEAGTVQVPLKSNRWQVRVVKEISWCNTFVPAGGCADVNGRRIAVARRMPAIEGILWAHEVGHTQGLLHRNDSNVALMWPSILPEHNLLTQTECDAFRK